LLRHSGQLAPPLAAQLHAPVKRIP
jgi:hypothetical protein